jgi:hypothetical protein
MKTKIIFALPIAISAALVSQSTFAISSTPTPTPHDLELTEVSSSTLTVTDNGSMTGISVMNTSPDHWTVTLPYTVQSGVFNGPGDEVEWLETSTFVSAPPIGSLPANDVSFATFMTSTFSVVSDIPNTQPSPAPDGTKITDVGTDTTDQTDVNMTFHDNAATAETTGVPETGSALGLLVLGLIALLGAKRLRSLQSA